MIAIVRLSYRTVPAPLTEFTEIRARHPMHGRTLILEHHPDPRRKETEILLTGTSPES